MIYTLPEIKKEVKKFKPSRITVHIEEFGEGFDTHVSFDYLDRYHNKESEYLQAGEEEKLNKAEKRAERITESLTKLGYKVENDGLANC